MNDTFHGNAGHSIKFYFSGFLENIDTSRVIQLQQCNFEEYLQFFMSQHQGIIPDEWYSEYFTSLVKKGYCYGVREDDRLVSVTDAPDIPYMSDVIVEPGINTLKPYRNKGYAKIAAGALIKHLLHEDKVPIWSCGSSNISSVKLAESLGYKKFADLFTLSLDENN